MKPYRYLLSLSIFSICGVIVSIYTHLLYGNRILLPSLFVMCDWIWGWSIAMLMMRTFDIFYSNNPALRYISILAFLSPITSIFQPIVYRSNYSNQEWFSILIYTSYCIECALLCFITISFLSTRAVGLRASTNNSLIEPNGPTLLGQGSNNIDTVIKSINYRASASQKASSLSLVIMVIIVLIGGGASIGTTALDELKRVREIEMERGKLLLLNERLEGFTKNNTTSVVDTSKAIMQFIRENYGKESNYETVLQKIEKRSQSAVTSWQDIVMRISIAVLSLFLVQVFFHIYRFNQQQSSHLWSKSETLELFKDGSEEQLQEMRSIILSKMDSSPKFGKAPTSGIEQVLEILNKAKNTSSS